jgi:hypothetical protein
MRLPTRRPLRSQADSCHSMRRHWHRDAGHEQHRSK